MASNVAQERKERGWSGHELARRISEAGCPVNQSAISKIEHGQRQVTVDELAALAQVFDITVEKLLQPPGERIAAALERQLETLGERQKALILASNAVTATVREIALTVMPEYFTPRLMDAMANQENAMISLVSIVMEVQEAALGGDPWEAAGRFEEDLNRRRKGD